MTGREDDAAKSPVFTDDAGSRWCRQQGAATDDDFTKSICCSHFDNDLQSLAIIKTAITTDHQGLSLVTFEGIKDRLHEVLQVMRLLECFYFFAQP